MKKLLLNANNNYNGIILRLTLSLILFPHGAQKMFGWFGGYGFTGTMDYFTSTVHLPWIIAFLIIIIECIGPFFLFIGFLSRIWALAVVVLFIGIIFTAHIDNGFFMNWFGQQKGEGYEFHLLVIGIALAIVTHGSGKLSVDERLLS